MAYAQSLGINDATQGLGEMIPQTQHFSTSTDNSDMTVTAASRLQTELTRVPLEDYMCQVYAPKAESIFTRNGIQANVVRWTNRGSNYFEDRMILFGMDTRFGRRLYDKHFNVMYLHQSDGGNQEIRIWDGFMPDHLRDLSLMEFVSAGFVDSKPIRAQWSRPPQDRFVMPKSVFLAGAIQALEKRDADGLARYRDFLKMGADNDYWSFMDYEIEAPRRQATGRRVIVR